MSGAAARRFGAAAASYEPAPVQAEVAARLAARIAERLAARPPATILEIGCGTGLLTRRLCGLFPRARIVATDAAAAMVARSKQSTDFTLTPALSPQGRGGTFETMHGAPLQGEGEVGGKPAARQGEGKIEWRVADAAHLPREFRRAFPLVASSAALHWLTPFADGLRAVADAVAADGALAAAIMVRGTLSELHAARAAAAPGCPPAAGLPTAEAVAAAVEAAGLRPIELARDTLVERHADGAACLRALHARGLTGGPIAAGTRLLGRGELRRLAAWLDEHARDVEGAIEDPRAHARGYAGGVRATYEVVYVWAVRG